MLQRLSISGAVIANAADRMTLRENAIAGGVQINDGIDLHVYRNQIGGNTGVQATGSPVNLRITHNRVTASGTGIAVNAAATALTIRDNVIAGGVTALDLQTAASGGIESNDLSGSGTALILGAMFTGTIAQNDIHGSQTGVAYHAAAEFGRNRIYENQRGVMTTVGGIVSSLGFIGAAGPNEIYQNDVGVDLVDAQVQNQHIHNNTTGVIGTGVLGGNELETSNQIRRNGIGANFGGTIQFNHFTENNVGIIAASGQLIAHNVLENDASIGVHLAGVSRVRVINNTIFAEQGDNIRLSGGAFENDIRNNILWSRDGTSIYAELDSQQGYFSDYNTLYNDGEGAIVHWVVDFHDLLDWQEELLFYDQNSLGSTAVNPVWAKPRFVSAASGDYRLLAPSAGQRLSSAPTNAGDPRNSQALPDFYTNILLNPSFESGVAGWTVNAGSSAGTTTAGVYDGANVFRPGATEAGFANQRVNLVAAGYAPDALDAGDLAIVFGGRIRTISENPVDQGRLRLVFLDANDQLIGQRKWTPET